MRRLILWIRAHPTVGDSTIAALLVVPEVAKFLVDDNLHAGPFQYVVTSALLVGPLVLRRRMPIVTSCVVLLGLFVHLLTHDLPDLHTGHLSLAIVLYTLVAYVGRKAAALHAAAVLGLWAAGALAQSPEPGDLVPGLGLFLLQQGLQLAFCWVLGEFAGARRAYQAEVEHRLRSLEFEQDQQARIAVAEERNRIAREIHDILAHSVSVMVAQADGAAYAVRSKPELAERAVQSIGTTGREALTELRSLLRVLRDEKDVEDERSPQPTASGVRELVDRVRGLELPVTLEIEGELDELPRGLGLGVYRIVQESLTNVLKHAGWKAAASVRIGHDGQQVTIEVTDTGAKGVLPPLASGGNGVIGMRERATAYGGSLQAGPGSSGGWRVHATIPVPGCPTAHSESEPAARIG
ncbi:signal transduction histidine kinase [Halopolyspora algeriensis]|uniref:histidine kinase n=1 Tax=Halopolyspora algeriensis TaxID=1500506 RepID=A0A368VY54_9ACTN|nr:histidine kinase [Halopolyspora algeriensis]RCW47128.1 signal transduction histidine kinase [Halopolyspora algeriensis]TQM48215.1 signal transduction histidine kinase [Halopolyspora algeriensis]